MQHSRELSDRAPLGMFVPCYPDPDRVTGQMIVMREFFAALVRAEQRGAIHAFGEWNRSDTLPQPRQRPAFLAPLRRAPDFVASTKIRAWHDTEPEIHRPLHLRQRWGRHRFPITIPIHNAHVQGTLRSIVHPLIWGPTAAYDAVITTSRALETSIRRLFEHSSDAFERRVGHPITFPGRIERIPWGVDTSLLTPRDAVPIRRRYEIDPSAFVLLYMGRVNLEQKADILPLLSVTRTLRRRHPEQNVQLVIAGRIGTEGYADAIEKRAAALRIESAVHVLGPFDPTDRADAYAIGDAFVSPTDWHAEGFNITTLEAMACGVPQIVSDWGGNRDAVIHGETGFLTPTWTGNCDDDLQVHELSESRHRDVLLGQCVAVDVDAMTAQVEMLIVNDDLRARMQTASRRRAQQHYDWSRVVEDHEQLWDELASQAERGSPTSRKGGTLSAPWFETFAHLSSQTLQAEDRVVTNRENLGRVNIDGAEASLYRGVVNAALLRFILTAVVRETTIAALAQQVQPNHSIASLTRHVLWLMKHGYVRVVRKEDV